MKAPQQWILGTLTLVSVSVVSLGVAHAHSVAPMSTSTSAIPHPQGISALPKVPDLGAPAGPRKGGGARYSPPRPPVGDAPIGRRRGGASRSECPRVAMPLTALVPTAEEKLSSRSTVTLVWGLTVDERPTLWFYVPYDNRTAYPAEFVLQDQEENEVYRTAIALPSRAGILSVRIPPETPGLDLNKSYRWYFNLYCDQQKKSPPIFVEGVIRRVSLTPAIAGQLATTDPRQQGEVFASNGIWFNALTTLAELRRTQPQDSVVAEDWKTLLQSIGLEEIAAIPLVK